MITIAWAEPETVAKARELLMGAAAEAIHDTGMCDHLAQLVEMVEREPALLAMPTTGMSVTEAMVWERVRTSGESAP
jgi:hypothetical protein